MPSIELKEEVLRLQRELKLANDAEVRGASSKVREELARVHAEATKRLLDQARVFCARTTLPRVAARAFLTVSCFLPLQHQLERDAFEERLQQCVLTGGASPFCVFRCLFDSFEVV